MVRSQSPRFDGVPSKRSEHLVVLILRYLHKQGRILPRGGRERHQRASRSGRLEAGVRHHGIEVVARPQRGEKTRSVRPHPVSLDHCEPSIRDALTVPLHASLGPLRKLPELAVLRPGETPLLLALLETLHNNRLQLRYPCDARQLAGHVIRRSLCCLVLLQLLRLCWAFLFLAPRGLLLRSNLVVAKHPLKDLGSSLPFLFLGELSLLDANNKSEDTLDCARGCVCVGPPIACSRSIVIDLGRRHLLYKMELTLEPLDALPPPAEGQAPNPLLLALSLQPLSLLTRHPAPSCALD
mmetsp:Transcript_23514/g.54678  ORF Transcript_23514/g.54678 Transcript_23514/m.54678 type:complete len:296 (+) Transcript_23514:116-1003(+)